MTQQCPDCGAFLRQDDDPALPDTHANEVCPADACPQDLVNEGVQVAEADEGDDEGDEGDLIEISTGQEAADILCSNLTSADLRSWASSHGVRNYAGRAKRPTAKMCVTQQPEAVAEWLAAQDLVQPTEGLAEQMGGVEYLHEAPKHTGSDVLAERLEELDEAVRDAPQEYRVTHLDLQPDGWTTVRVEAPDHHWTNEGETHADVFYCTLRENGGLQTLQVRDQFSGHKHDLAEDLAGGAGRAWARFLEQVRDAEA